MKRLLFLLAIAIAAIGLTSCENYGTAGENEVVRSSSYAWSYFGQSFDKVDAELIKKGWQRTYVGKDDDNRDRVLYIFNMPMTGWHPCYFTDFSYSRGSYDKEALGQQLQSGKAYGELALVCYDKEVQGVGLLWVISSLLANTEDTYKAFSNRIYKAYISDGGNANSWSGKIHSEHAMYPIEYSDHETFIEALSEFSNPCTTENVTASSPRAQGGTWSLESCYNYFISGDFVILFGGEKK